MKNELKSKRPIRNYDAKRTALGRFFCRLLGDERGQGLMEYVILGVLVIAAVVTTAVLFGSTIRGNFMIMIYAIQNNQEMVEYWRNRLAEESTSGSDRTQQDFDSVSGSRPAGSR